MSRRRHETDAEWMERVRQTRMFLNGTMGNNPGANGEQELRAFLSLFFPDLDSEEVQRIVNNPRRTI